MGEASGRAWNGGEAVKTLVGTIVVETSVVVSRDGAAFIDTAFGLLAASLRVREQRLAVLLSAVDPRHLTRLLS